MLPTKLQFIWLSGFREDVLEINQSEKNNCLWLPCLLTVWDEMCKFYIEPSIDVSYQVSVHLAKPFQRRRLHRNQPIRNKNCLWLPCLLTDKDEMRNFNREPSIEASYQVSVNARQALGAK